MFKYTYNIVFLVIKSFQLRYVCANITVFIDYFRGIQVDISNEEQEVKTGFV